MTRYAGVEYGPTDSIETLSREQLELIAASSNDLFLDWLESRSKFDVQQIRLMLELGAAEAKRRLAGPIDN